jgi:hypothetical protein
MAHALEGDLEHFIERSGSVWDPLAGTDVFLTGGTGFVGSWLLKSFAWANKRLNLRARIFVLTRDPERFRTETRHLAREESVRILNGDLQTFPLPRKSFRIGFMQRLRWEPLSRFWRSPRRMERSGCCIPVLGPCMVNNQSILETWTSGLWRRLRVVLSMAGEPRNGDFMRWRHG